MCGPVNNGKRSKRNRENFVRDFQAAYEKEFGKGEGAVLIAEALKPLLGATGEQDIPVSETVRPHSQRNGNGSNENLQWVN
jgi:hypothetical protein